MNPELLEAMSQALDLDDWPDHHRAIEIVDALATVGYAIVPCAFEEQS